MEQLPPDGKVNRPEGLSEACRRPLKSALHHAFSNPARMNVVLPDIQQSDRPVRRTGKAGAAESVRPFPWI